MTPTQLKHIMSLPAKYKTAKRAVAKAFQTENFDARIESLTNLDIEVEAYARAAVEAYARAAVEAALRDAPQAEGWKEAAIAWTICASIHEQWAKGKDALFKTRQADFSRHADDARAMLAARPSAPTAVEPTAEWNTELGQRCPHCDGTGDVHSIDGQWRGRCYCPEGQASPNSASTAVGPNEQAEFEAWFKQGGDYDPDWLAFSSEVQGQYSNQETQNMWLAWQARASKGTPR